MAPTPRRPRNPATADPSAPEATPGRTTASDRTRRTARRSSPPNRVEPGWIHTEAANFTLKLLHTKLGIDVGNVAAVATAGNGEAGPEPSALLARIFAHMGHRLPGFRRLEKRLEGTDAKAGIGADFTAFATQLYRRNSDKFDELAPQVIAAGFAMVTDKNSATGATGATASTDMPPFDPSIPEAAPIHTGGTPT